MTTAVQHCSPEMSKSETEKKENAFPLPHPCRPPAVHTNFGSRGVKVLRTREEEASKQASKQTMGIISIVDENCMLGPAARGNRGALQGGRGIPVGWNRRL